MMFNKDYRKFAVQRLEESVNQYNKVTKEMIDNSEMLFKTRIELKRIIREVEDYINALANTPKEIKVDVQKIQISLDNYQEILDIVENEIKESDFQGKAGAAAGVAAGLGVAAFAPTAAMGIATTFGVASTGTAISTLTGAAFTNAALAWLGGGALTAGGAGMAGGTALIGLAGPIGWTIGGASLIGSGLLMNGKNKKIVADANQKNVEVTAQLKIQEGLIVEIKELRIAALKNKRNLIKRLDTAKEELPKDYSSMDTNQKYMLGSMINIALATAQDLNKTVGVTK